MPGQGSERADRAPVVSVARPWRPCRCQPPRRRDRRPARRANLVQTPRDDCSGVPRGGAQTPGPAPPLAAGVRSGTEHARARSRESQAPALHHAPASPHGVLCQPRPRRPHRAQRPAAGDRARLSARPFLARSLTRSRAPPLPHVLVPEFPVRDVTSGVPPRGGGSRGQRRLPLHRPVTRPSAGPGPAGSAIPGGPRRAGSRPAHSLVRRRPARARRAAPHEHDRVPVLVAPPSLASPFVVSPSRCACALRWPHITDVDRQSSLGSNHPQKRFGSHRRKCLWTSFVPCGSRLPTSLALAGSSRPPTWLWWCV